MSSFMPKDTMFILTLLGIWFPNIMMWCMFYELQDEWVEKDRNLIVGLCGIIAILATIALFYT